MNDFKPPACDHSDPAQLAAFYGPYGFFEPYRKVTLAHCQEVLRGQFALRKEKVTETRLDALAHTHPLYLEFLAEHLRGRVAYEAMHREDMNMVR